MPKFVAPSPATDTVSVTANGADLNRGGKSTHKFAVPFVLTNPVRVAADGAQALRLAVPVTPFHALNLTLQAFLVESATTVNIAVETAMQNESEDGWQTVDTFTAVVSSPTMSLKVFTGLLRYVRYRVSLNGTAAISFAIQGVAYGSRSQDAQHLRSTKQCAGNCGSDGAATQCWPGGSDGVGTAARSIGVVNHALNCALIEIVGCDPYYTCIDDAKTAVDLNACVGAHLQNCLNAKGDARRCRRSQTVQQ